ncbi:MAG: FAD-dependent oxidoreductase [Pseudomonadota bacterium]
MTAASADRPGRAPDIAIIGAGIIGLSCAWALARRGARITVYDTAAPGRGASWAAAGMLAPGFEAAGEQGAHPELFEFCLAGAALWPDFADALTAATGVALGFDKTPTLAIATCAGEAARLAALEAALAAKGVASEALLASEARALEPTLSGETEGGLLLPTDMQVDNRAVVAALIDAARQAGVAFADAEPPEAAVRIQCTGWRTKGVAPVGGQVVSLSPDAGRPTRVVRAGDLYIVPKSDRTLIGATVEPGRTRGDADAEIVADLQARAARLCPTLAAGGVLEAWAGVRPATPDHAPMIGWTAPARLVATGHYRNGVLLAPITAEIVADMALGGAPSELAAAFAPDRFAAATP